MKKITEEEVLQTMRKALGPEGRKLDVNSTVKDFETWDSLGHLGILAALDKKFDGQVAEISELAGVDSVKSLLDILKKNSLI